MDEENTTNDYPMRNILLVGFMGCGKSTIGRILHKSLDYPFIDTDQQIEKQTQKKISTLFAEEGEEAFRTLETQFLEQLIEKQTNHAIIATGGGIITRPENIPLLRQLGFVIWLTCSPEIIYERTSRNNNRPLLQCENPKEIIATMLAQRAPLYQAASHLKIDSSDLDVNEMSCGILESARYHFGSGSPAPCTDHTAEA